MRIDVFVIFTVQAARGRGQRPDLNGWKTPRKVNKKRSKERKTHRARLLREKYFFFLCIKRDNFVYYEACNRTGGDVTESDLERLTGAACVGGGLAKYVRTKSHRHRNDEYFTKWLDKSEVHETCWKKKKTRFFVFCRLGQTDRRTIFFFCIHATEIWTNF